jgi:hypothetical protein
LESNREFESSKLSALYSCRVWNTNRNEGKIMKPYLIKFDLVGIGKTYEPLIEYRKKILAFC